MDAGQIQAKINYGFGKAATYLGTTCNWYRPTDFQNAVTDAALQGTIIVRFDPKPNFQALIPSAYGKPQWFAAFDRTDTLVGDYLIQTSTIDGLQPETFFIASQESLEPTMVILCNAVLTFSRPTQNAPGADFYGGEKPLAVNYLVNWPGSVVEGPKGNQSVADLPTETRAPWYKVLLPGFIGIEITPFDVMVDQNGARYTVSSTELTPLGWRLTVGYAGA